MFLLHTRTVFFVNFVSDSFPLLYLLGSIVFRISDFVNSQHNFVYAYCNCI